MPEQSKSLVDRFLRPILASRFLTISAFLHLLLVVLLGGRVLFKTYVEPPDFEAPTTDFVESGDTAPEPPPPTPTDALPPAPTVATAPPPPSVPAMAMTTTNMSTTAFTMQAPTLAPPTISPDVAVQQAAPSVSSQGLPGLPGPMNARGTRGRSAAQQQYGAKPNSEQAVLKALRWLQTQQKTDGTWGTTDEGAMTGLALLCYLGHGETPDNSPEFKVVVANAINALIAEGEKNEGRFSYFKDFSKQPSVYQHAICTYALSEAYTMTKNEKLPPILAQAVGYILKGQLANGGWIYHYDTTGKSPADLDTSVTGWQVQALKAAHLTGLPGMDAIHDALDNAIKALDTLFSYKDGSYGYHKIGDKPYTLTGVGALCKLFWQGKADRMVTEALKNIKSKDLNYAGSDASLYAWYYDTQACFQAQGSAWEWWNKRFQDQLLNKQNPDGSWPITGGKEPGVKNEAEAAVYRTTLCTLMLEVYYRYLPTSKATSMGGGGVDGL